MNPYKRSNYIEIGPVKPVKSCSFLVVTKLSLKETIEKAEKEMNQKILNAIMLFEKETGYTVDSIDIFLHDEDSHDMEIESCYE